MPPKKSISKRLRTLIWDKYIGKDKRVGPCYSCGYELNITDSWHCGHRVAECKGGTLNIDNLRPICAQCNLSCATQNLDDFKKSLEQKEQKEIKMDISELSDSLFIKIVEQKSINIQKSLNLNCTNLGIVMNNFSLKLLLLDIGKDIKLKERWVKEYQINSSNVYFMLLHGEFHFFNELKKEKKLCEQHGIDIPNYILYWNSLVNESLVI